MSIDGPRTCDPTSQMRALASPIRNYERELIEVLDRHGGNMAPAYDESCRSCTPPPGPALNELGVRREGNPHARVAMARLRLRARSTSRRSTPTSPCPCTNHGTWEFIAPYRGTLDRGTFGPLVWFSERGDRTFRLCRRNLSGLCTSFWRTVGSWKRRQRVGPYGSPQHRTPSSGACWGRQANH